MSTRRWTNITASLAVPISRDDDEWFTESDRSLPPVVSYELDWAAMGHGDAAELLIEFTSSGHSSPGRTNCRNDDAEPPDFEDCRTIRRVTVFDRELSQRSVDRLAKFFESEIQEVVIEELSEI